jgi:hypothetical protein
MDDLSSFQNGSEQVKYINVPIFKFILNFSNFEKNFLFEFPNLVLNKIYID